MKNNIIMYILLIFIIIYTALPLARRAPAEEATSLNGTDLKGITQDNLDDMKLIIVLDRQFMGDIDPETGGSLSGIPVAGEYIIIFGDGTVFSERYCHKTWVENYFTGNFNIDDTWRLEEGSQSYIRRCRYYLEKQEIIAMLNLISTHEGKLLPGINTRVCGMRPRIQVILDNRYGCLSELISPPIGDQENLGIINTVHDKVKELEGKKDLEVLTSKDYFQFCEEKKSEFGWAETKLSALFYHSKERN